MVLILHFRVSDTICSVSRKYGYFKAIIYYDN